MRFPFSLNFIVAQNIQLTFYSVLGFFLFYSDLNLSCRWQTMWTKCIWKKHLKVIKCLSSYLYVFRIWIPFSKLSKYSVFVFRYIFTSILPIPGMNISQHKIMPATAKLLWFTTACKYCSSASFHKNGTWHSIETKRRSGRNEKSSFWQHCCCKLPSHPSPPKLAPSIWIYVIISIRQLHLSGETTKHRILSLDYSR